MELREDAARTITERVLGECWHEFIFNREGMEFPCQNCGEMFNRNDLYSTGKLILMAKYPLDPSTWQGFGRWFEKAQTMPWWWEFVIWFLRRDARVMRTNSQIWIDFINPIRAANLITEFLVERRGE